VTKKSKWLVRIGNWVKAHGGGTVIPFSVEFEQVLYILHTTDSSFLLLEVLHKCYCISYCELSTVCYHHMCAAN
jgi:hypothetical protein